MSTPSTKTLDCRPWLWVTVIVMSGLCSGITGLYTGASITEQHNAKTISDLRSDYEKRLSDQDAHSQQELSRSDRELDTLSLAVTALTEKVGGLSSKVDKHAATVDKAQAVAQDALKEAKINSAKTDYLSAKVAETASTVKAPPVVPTPTQDKWLWWSGSTKR
jgi:hypothetical protein